MAKGGLLQPGPKGKTPELVQHGAEATDGDPTWRLHAQSVFQPGELTPPEPKFPAQESWESTSGPAPHPLPPHKSRSSWLLLWEWV